MGLAVCKIVAFYLHVHPMWHVVLGESPGRDNLFNKYPEGTTGPSVHVCWGVVMTLDIDGLGLGHVEPFSLS